MKRSFSAILCMIFLISFLLPAQPVFAAGESTAPLPGYIIVMNNLNKADTVYVYGLSPGDLVKVYNSASGGTVLAYTVVPGNKSDVTISIDQLGSSAGSIYVSVINKGKDESSRTKAEYSGEPLSEAPSPNDIMVTNNAGKADTIYMTGLNAKDVVKVYDAAIKGKLLATRTIATNASDLTITIPQLGASAGKIYVSVTSKNKLESSRVEVGYDAEVLSDAPLASNVTITNNVKGSDSIYVSGLNEKDIVKVYNAQTGGKLLGSKTVATNGADVTITVSQLGSAPGYVYVSVTGIEKAESPRTKVAYPAEPGSDAPAMENIMVTNNAGKADTVYVIGLSTGDVVKVYSAVEKGNLLGTATASNSTFDATVSIAQLGAKAGSVFVSVTGTGKVESGRTEAVYAAEGKSSGISEDSIIVTNNVGKADTVYVKDINPGDTVKVYNASSGGSLLGSKTAGSSEVEVTITIAQLGTGSGYIYVAVVSGGKAESARTQTYYDAESVSDGLNANNISVTNNAGAADTIYVSGLTPGDTVKVYNSLKGGTLLGSATVAASKNNVTISIPQMGTSSGNVYLTVTRAGSQESPRVTVSYDAEGESAKPGINSIVVANNVGKADTVYVSGLTGGDVVSVYNSASQGTLLGTATVSASATDATVTVPQLGTSQGTIYVTVTSPGKMESGRVEVAYKGESSSDNLNKDNISATNNAGISDTIYVSGLTSGDVVKVYDSALGGTLLGTATVASTATDVTVTVSQLGTAAGSVFVTVTSSNKAESGRVEAAYTAESGSAAPVVENIIVTNNIAGTPDTVYAVGLKTGDIVKVYNAATQGTLLGNATVSGSNTDVTISISQLGSDQGSVYVTVTSVGKLESNRTEAAYSAEGKSTVPLSGNITVTNNAGTSDTVYVSGLTANDIVKVYDAPRGGTQLGTATVGAYSSNVTVTVTQLGSTAGSVYVTVTSTNKSESGRVQAEYSAEPSSSGLTGGNITITNNAGSPDTVEVTGLSAGDVVKVYDASRGGNQIGTATVPSDGTSVTISIAQLGNVAGSVYITVTNTNRLESDRIPADYPAEAKTDAPAASKIFVINNAGIASTVVVTGLKDNDVVKVYDAPSGGTQLGNGKVGAYGTELSISVSQLGSSGGSVYVTVTSTGKLESNRTEAVYEGKVITSAPSVSDITIVNNAGIADTVTVTGLDEGTVIKVYTTASGSMAAGTAKVPSGNIEATASITQLGSAAGTVYVSLTAPGKTESNRTKADYAAEAASEPLVAGNVIVANNSGISDTITITGLSERDVVKIYNAAAGGTRIATVTAAADSFSTVVTYPQLGTGAGSIYVSVTSLGKTESARTKVDFVAESAAPFAANIVIVNNAGIADTITVYGLAENDMIRVYDAPSSGNLLGTAFVTPGNTSATVSVSQLTTTAGSVYVTVANFGKAESSRTKADYIAEQNTGAPYEGNVKIVNNAGSYDTVTVMGLTSGDFVKVYDSLSGGSLLGSATVATGATQVVITISQLGVSSGSVYISVTGTGKTESSRTKADYTAEK